METSLLYKAATESLVSDASATSTFEKMITCAYTHSDVASFKKELIETERIIRTEFEITSMPGPWRSSKSVLLQSMSMGISLVDHNGSYVGKTFLQNKIKESKLAVKEPLTNQEYANKIIYLLLHFPPSCDSATVASLVKSFLIDM